ncbi:iron uptake transporter deferrochelatase/peroxidase subunit [Fodinicola acaciae]|uniref:iron uptake transporter deferrochelatase/peroxidase subunit n=1 Tax=Fodinicola acaciae TaxID=2681555 RepID=UPI0013D6A046|nr:iron uptake transporter deferrochelatase/peroxidase subunit [Fodinicola acaciae]
MSESRRISRRGLLGAAIGGGVAVGAGGYALGHTLSSTAAAASTGSPAVPFYGEHQAGIATPAQDRLAFAAFDLTSTSRDDLRELLVTWTQAAVKMTAGQPVGPTETLPDEPPVDTGEAMGLAAGGLTLTIGFGPSLFDKRFGLAARKPAALQPLPPLPGDELRPEISNGDIGVQACADDPQVAFHAIRNFARLARGVAVLRWSQLGFGRTATTSSSQATPRNLMGFKDGTNNIKLEDDADLRDFVWVGDETDQPWLRGGSYLVTRRIRMHIESWDRDRLGDQEAVFGRVKTTGAPLGGKDEFDPVDLGSQSRVAANAHIRLAAPASNGGRKILRRGYSYTDGIDARTGELDAGLFFICYQRDPAKQFVPIQRKLGANDALNEYITHTSSAVFACPPGASAGKPWGADLFR